MTWVRNTLAAACVAAAAVGAFAQEQTPTVKKEYARTVEIAEPSAFTGVKDTRFVLTKDLTVPRVGALKFKQCEHIEIDLDGHTITYNTEDYNPRKEWGAGVQVSYSRDVVIKGGTIVQAEMDPAQALGVGYTDDVVIDGMNIIVRRALRDREKGGVTPHPTTAISIYRYGDALKKVPPKAAYKNVIRNCYLENGRMALGEAYDYEITGNVLVNAHCGINARGSRRPPAGRRGAKHKIHHNLIQSLRVVGWKSPCALYLAAGRECEVFENKVASDDARGFISSGGGLEKNVFHHNEISARYKSASAIGYIDNRPYGIWTRNSWGTVIHHNRILVINSSPFKGGRNYAIGILCAKFRGQGPSNDEFTIRDNVITVMHDFANQTSTGISFGPNSKGIFGKNETIRNNVIRAQTLCFNLDAEYFDPDSKNICAGNRMIKPGKHDAGWRVANLKLPAGNPIETEKPDATAPAAPTGLKLRSHMGRAIIEWKWNAEDDVVGYWIYRNGKRIPGTRFRGATFYIDVTPTDGDRYSVSARDFSGNESQRSFAVVFKK